MPLKSFDEYVALAEVAHGHMCAGQILGLRLAIYGVTLLGLDDPAGKDRKRLVSFVEIDRCATDAVPIVTGCRMGKRALKFRDFGKVAATFCDLREDRAVRVVARESSKQRARELYPEIVDKNAQQMRAYREMPVEELFDIQWVRVRLSAPKTCRATRPRARSARNAARASTSSGKSCARRQAIVPCACAGRALLRAVVL